MNIRENLIPKCLIICYKQHIQNQIHHPTYIGIIIEGPSHHLFFGLYNHLSLKINSEVAFSRKTYLTSFIWPSVLFYVIITTSIFLCERIKYMMHLLFSLTKSHTIKLKTRFDLSNLTICILQVNGSVFLPLVTLCPLSFLLFFYFISHWIPA